MDIRKIFGTNARKFRLALELSQEAVAERMGVDRAFISSMERGQQNVTLLTIWETARALEVRPVDLLDKKNPRLVANRASGVRRLRTCLIKPTGLFENSGLRLGEPSRRLSTYRLWARRKPRPD